MNICKSKSYYSKVKYHLSLYEDKNLAEFGTSNVYRISTKLEVIFCYILLVLTQEQQQISCRFFFFFFFFQFFFFFFDSSPILLINADVKSAQLYLPWFCKNLLFTVKHATHLIRSTSIIWYQLPLHLFPFHKSSHYILLTFHLHSSLFTQLVHNLILFVLFSIWCMYVLGSTPAMWHIPLSDFLLKFMLTLISVCGKCCMIPYLSLPCIAQLHPILCMWLIFPNS